MPDPSALSTGFAELEAGPSARVRVWDLPTRVFHWALAGSVTVQLATGLLGVMEWHFRCGYLILALLCFRLCWGVVGGHWSRFGRLAYPPSALGAYLRGEAPLDHRVGHSPLGALSVAAMLTLLMLQIGSGLVSDDEVSATGPLTRFVSNETVSLASAWHATAGVWIVPALVALHLVAIAFYLLRQQNLVRPMFTGDKLLNFQATPSRDTAGTRLLALFIFAGCATFAYWISTFRA